MQVHFWTDCVKFSCSKYVVSFWKFWQIQLPLISKPDFYFYFWLHILWEFFLNLILKMSELLYSFTVHTLGSKHYHNKNRKPFLIYFDLDSRTQMRKFREKIKIFLPQINNSHKNIYKNYQKKMMHFCRQIPFQRRIAFENRVKFGKMALRGSCNSKTETFFSNCLLAYWHTITLQILQITQAISEIIFIEFARKI